MLTLKLATEIVQLIDLRSFKWVCEIELPMEFLEKRLEWGQTRKKNCCIMRNCCSVKCDFNQSSLGACTKFMRKMQNEKAETTQQTNFSK